MELDWDSGGGGGGAGGTRRLTRQGGFRLSLCVQIFSASFPVLQ